MLDSGGRFRPRSTSPAPRTSARHRITPRGVLVALAAGLVVAAAPLTASAQQGTDLPAPVSSVPATGTPDIQNGAVFTLAQVGSQVVAGGTFTSVAPAPGGSLLTRDRVLAFDGATGALNTGFAPALDGEVRTVAAGPVPGTVYVGGAFQNVGGVPDRFLALLDTATGLPVPGFRPVINGEVWDAHLVGGRLLIAGVFTKVGGAVHDGLATVNPLTGAVDPYMQLQTAGHHNYRGVPGVAKAPVGPRRVAVSPDGTRAVIVGNFTTVDSVTRDQVAVIDLGPTAAVLDPSWATSAFSAECYPAWDTYMRDVSFAPDGSYFVIATTGGYGQFGGHFMCDSVSRWDVASTGADVTPTWVQWSGGDTFESVQATSSAIYVGGHFRWLNNPLGYWNAQPGSVPRPGIGALDPVNGLPLAWNPGRNPRGVGATALLTTSNGLYVGSDTTWIGNRTYRRGRVAFFPAAPAGTPAPQPAMSLPLPVRICQGGQGAGTMPPAPVECRSFDGKSVGPAVIEANSCGFDWAAQAFAFQAGGQVFAVDQQGTLTEHSYGVSGLGAGVVLDPYNDPTWSTIPTGFLGGQTYRGLAPTLLSTPGTVTSSFVDGGRLYVTFAGDRSLHWAAFTPQDGVIGGVTAQGTGDLDLSTAHGAFVAGSTLYWVDGAGHLNAADFNSGNPLAAGNTVISGPGVDGVNWLSGPLFTLPGA